MSERYVDILKTFIAKQLQNISNLHKRWHPLDGATTLSYCRLSIAIIQQLFGYHIISLFGDIH